MKKQLQNKLFKKYKKIFRQKDLPKDQTCTCWGIDCGDGWFWLLDMLCGCIQNYIDNNKHLKITQVEASQVKEKGGGLRFYIDGVDEESMIKQDYTNKISEKTKIDTDLIQISLWPFDDFRREHREGNSFTYFTKSFI